MNSAPGITLAALLLLPLAGCASSHQAAAAADGTTTATSTTDASTKTPADASADSSSEDKDGAGHVSLTGEYATERDFVVSGCVVGPPGDGLLSGYHMTTKEGTLGLLAVTLKDFTKDGAYEQAAASPEAAVSRAMSTGIMGPLTMMLAQGEGEAPLAFMQVAASKLTVTISGEGAKGIAEFTNIESMPTAADIMASKSGEPPHGKRVSGSVTWTCGKVEHLNGKMNDAVNGMFKKHIPPR
jgi:hypothetical protein